MNNFFIKKEELKTKFDFVFLSEGANYQKYFIKLVKELNKYNFKILYISFEKNDKIDFVKTINLTNSLTRLFYLRLIKSKFILMTLTDLNNHEIKKNNNIDYYVYVFHSAQSTHKQYTKTAFDNYDIILCPTIFHKNELLIAEKKRNLKKKQLINIGYFFLDYIREQNNKSLKNNFILIAPSWNYSSNNFLEKEADKIIYSLLNETNFNLILRPHAEHLKRNKNTLKKIENKYKTFKKFKIDYEANNMNSLVVSRILITDLSGIALEFMLGLLKPVIYFDYPKVHNKFFSDVNNSTFEELVKIKFGFNFVKSENISISDQIKLAEKKMNKNRFKLNKITERLFYNIDNSVDKAKKFFIDFE